MPAYPASARHETRALLRAHLAAATSYRHLTRHCPICHRLLRLAMEPTGDPRDAAESRDTAPEAHEAHEAPGTPESAETPEQCEDESPPKA
ncbi:DUF6274 family protein [Streptomyces flavofungini]|uniref:Uncharacterized protein n=1 Tax=Streptomyces flavofungini TaxID=68200 RepID=A0ABS0XHB1_9ACTN|nr:DUF6274 family protein [Streptomyces flavofungini]MBJ3812605.1 hypothetical protein [Streptomyces flavofungini]GHC87706.1 hypothetical protein GCM10010349_74490 [Streptomyces flavofungini]